MIMPSGVIGWAFDRWIGMNFIAFLDEGATMQGQGAEAWLIPHWRIIGSVAFRCKDVVQGRFLPLGSAGYGYVLASAGEEPFCGI